MVEKNVLCDCFEKHYQCLGDVDQALDEVIAEHKARKNLVEAVACELGYLPARYSRNCGTLGPLGQAKLLRSKVIVAGLGGLGGYVVEQLARCGVGTVIGVDPDHFELSNLNRQMLCDKESLGKGKAHTAKARVARVNDAVEFIARNCRIEELTDKDYTDCRLLFDCLDSISVRLFLERRAAGLDLPMIHGAIGGWYGQVAVLNPAAGTLGKIYHNHGKGIEQRLGNPPFTPVFIAGAMVSEGVKVLLGKKKPDNVLQYWDLLENTFQRIET